MSGSTHKASKDDGPQLFIAGVSSGSGSISDQEWATDVKSGVCERRSFFQSDLGKIAHSLIEILSSESLTGDAVIDLTLDEFR